MASPRTLVHLAGHPGAAGRTADRGESGRPLRTPAGEGPLSTSPRVPPSAGWTPMGGAAAG